MLLTYGQVWGSVQQFGMTSQELQIVLGSNINRFRQLQSLTVEVLAEKSSVSIGHLMDVIHGRKWVSSDLLVRISQALSVPVHQFFTPNEESGGSPEVLVSEMGHELADKIGALIKETTKEYLRKGSAK